MNEFLPAKPPRRCPACGCTDGNDCLTTLGGCFGLAGSRLCGACLFPKIRLRGPLAGESLDMLDVPLTMPGLCVDAREGDPESIRWFWAIYGRLVRKRLLAA